MTGCSRHCYLSRSVGPGLCLSLTFALVILLPGAAISAPRPVDVASELEALRLSSDPPPKAPWHSDIRGAVRTGPARIAAPELLGKPCCEMRGDCKVVTLTPNAHRLRLEAEEQLRHTTLAMVPASQRPDFLFRLATLYWTDYVCMRTEAGLDWRVTVDVVEGDVR